MSILTLPLVVRSRTGFQWQRRVRRIVALLVMFIPRSFFELSPALLLYEYAITIDQEWNAVWRRKWTLVSGLLITIRWDMLAFAFISLLPVVIPTVGDTNGHVEL